VGHDVWLESLRRAAGDPEALARLLGDALPNDALQLIGDAVLTVLEPSRVELAEVVDRLVVCLRGRGWDGDDELADALEHVAGRRSSSLRALLVGLDEVGEALAEQFGTEHYLDLETGMVWSQSMIDFGVADDFEVDFSDESRWLFVVGEGSDEAYRDLRRFIDTVVDDNLAARLTEAIQGRGAFRRFRSVLERDPVEFTRWHRFAADARLGHARSWLAGRGYAARPIVHFDVA
jgi:hypothetical protein